MRAHKAPKWPPRGSQEAPKRAQEASKTSPKQYPKLKIRKPQKLRPFHKKNNDVAVPEREKISSKYEKYEQNQDKIAVNTSTPNKDHQEYTPRPSWRPTGSPKKRLRIIDGRTRKVIFGALGPPKVL